MRKIRNLDDLAHHLHADVCETNELTLRSIYKRLDKDSDVGGHVGEGVIDHKYVTYVVRCALGITGWKVLGWRKQGGRRGDGIVALPSALADYLDTEEHNPQKVPTLCKRYNEGNAAHEFGRAWMAGLELDECLLRKTEWARGVILTIRVKEPIIGILFTVSGCASGDYDLPDHSVALPATGREVDDAIVDAQVDSIEDWEKHSGCPARQTIRDNALDNG